MNTSSSFANIATFWFSFILGNKKNPIISLMTQLLYGAFENVIFQIDSTILSQLCNLVVSFLHSSYLGRSSILWPQKSLILVLYRQLSRCSHYLEWLFQLSQGLLLLGFSNVFIYWILNPIEAAFIIVSNLIFLIFF